LKKRTTLLVYFFLVSLYSVAQVPVANFSSNIKSGCSPIIVNFNDLSLGNPTTWAWDFGNGATSSKKDPSTTYFAPGKYTVSLTVTNSRGTHTTKREEYIIVNEAPKVDFISDTTTGCSPLNVRFADRSDAGTGNTNVSWLWDFGNGVQSTERNPTATFRTAGEFTVFLQVTNDKGCTKYITKTAYIKVTPGVQAGFYMSGLTSCNAPVQVNFTNYSTGPGQLTYLWNFGDGTTSSDVNPSHTYTSTGKFTVSLAVSSSSGCSDLYTADSLVQITGIKTDFTIPNPICLTSGAKFVNLSNATPVASFWEFSDGEIYTSKNAFRFFNTPGTYNVKLTNTYKTCSETVVKTLKLSSKPTANFISDSVKCQPPFTVNFQNLTTNGASYKWSFGDGSSSSDVNPSHTFNAYGDFPVTLISFNENGCSDTIQKSAYIKVNKPTITFSNLPQGGCAPFTVSPIAVIKSLEDVLSYTWNFGDGTTSNEQFPSHSYATPGTYNISLTMKTRSGCTETYSLANAVKVGTKPKAAFTAQPLKVCAREFVNFTNESANADDFLWHFGDGGTSKSKDPSYQYNDLEWFDVKLIAYNNGCPDSITRERYIYIKPPIAAFVISPDCNNKRKVIFKDQSSGAQTWYWDFGDGTTSKQQNPPMHTYAAFGNYTVSLTVTNDSCTHTASQVINITNIKPDFTATPKVACNPQEVSFVPFGSNITSIDQFSWSFGEGTTDTSSGPTKFTYNKTGYYDVTLFINDKYGCKDTIEKKQYIRINGPVAKFASNNPTGCSGMTTMFQDSTITDGVNRIVTWKWDFGDSIVQTFNNPPFQHTYNDVGYYDVKLVVQDAAGCTDTAENSNFIKLSYLKAEWYVPDASCPGANNEFYNYTKGSSFSTLWDFGDGTTSTDIAAKHTYADTGVYNVKLKVQDRIGCIDSLTKSFEVGIPVASFTVNNPVSYCTPFQARFKNTSNFAYILFWDLDGGTSSQPNPVNYYTEKGNYNIKLVVESPGGCKDSTTKQITVKGIEDAQISYNPHNGCNPLTVDMKAFSEMNGKFLWDFGDGNLVDTGTNKITHKYTNIGKFVPKIILQEPGGCIIPVTGPDTIRIRGAKADFTFNKNFFCDSGYIVTVDSTRFNEPIVSYDWDFGDGTTSTAQNPAHKYLSPGIYTIALAVRTQSGCVDTMKSKTPVKIVASPQISIGGDSVICVNDTLRHIGVFERPDSSAVQWSWQFPNGNRAFVQYPANQLYQQPGTFTVTTIATNTSGCADTSTKNILVNPLPVVTMPSTLTIQTGYPVTIAATYTSNVIGYTWTPPASLSCSNCPQPVASPKFNTVYKVSFVDSNGCRNTGEIQIILFCKNSNVFVPNTFSPNGDGSNDIFYVRGRGLERVKMLRVINRWGEIVFEKRDFSVNDASAGWDGRYKSNKPQPDVYVYQLEVYCDNGDIVRFDGNVALIQ
jgi:gliding motility-associated-like protein